MTHALPVLAALATIAAADAPSADRAFRLAARGDLADASREARRAVAARPGDRLALLVEASVAIERNELERATDLADRLDAAGSPRGAVVRRLAERRRAHPGEPMRIALAEAWRAAGAPDLSGDARPRPDWELDLLGLGSDPLPKLGAAERAAVGGWAAWKAPRDAATRAAQVEQLERAAARATRNPLWVNLVLLTSVRADEEDPPERWARVADAERRLAAAAIAADPGNGYFRMVGLVVGAEARRSPKPSGVAALSPQDLDALEAALAQPRFVWPWGTIRREAAARLRAVDPAHGELRGAVVSMEAIPLYPTVVGFRALRTDAPDARARAARVVAAIARHLSRSGVLVERMVGGLLDQNAAAASGDPAELERAKARNDALRAWHERLSAAARRLGQWPLASVWRELDPEDEVAYFERLAR